MKYSCLMEFLGCCHLKCAIYYLALIVKLFIRNMSIDLNIAVILVSSDG